MQLYQKRDSMAQVFSYEFCKIFKKTFFTEHLRWLLLQSGVEKRNLIFLIVFKLGTNVLSEKHEPFKSLWLPLFF